jgi:DeoR family ulaG and ulaABCDEF operon transcriptional repressor
MGEYMLPSEREKVIINSLNNQKFCTLNELVNLTKASPATLRRDLNNLEEKGIIKRVHGGAELVHLENTASRMSLLNPGEVPYDLNQPFDVRLHINEQRKNALSRAAVSLCNNNETILIDGGTTTYFMVKYLTNYSLNIITNSIIIAHELIQTNNRIIVPAGIISPGNMLILDYSTGDQYSQYNIQKAFIPVEGFNINGPICSDVFHMRMKSSLIQRAEEIIIMVDGTKFDRAGALRLCQLDQIDMIITNSDMPNRYKDIFSSHEIRIIYAD